LKKLFYILFILAFLSCTKNRLEHITKIQSGEVVNIEGAFFLQGQIIDISSKGDLKFGHLLSKNNYPSFQNSIVLESNNASVGKQFLNELTQLELNQNYYFCAFAIQGNDTLLFEVKTFNLTNSVILSNNCSLQINNNQILDNSSVSVESELLNLKSFKIKEYGVCWTNENQNPDISSNKTIHYNLENQVFNDTLSNLFEATNYYIRSYVKLDDNTVIYSNSTTINISALAVKTINYSVNGQVAILQGEITQLGVEPITDHGFCWSTLTSNPSFNNELISLNGTNALGYFYSNLNLTTNTTYYFRAYAIQGNEIKYGQIKSIQF